MRIGTNVVRVCALSLAFALIARTQASEVWVVTDSAHPATVHPGVRHIQLDAAEKILSKLSSELPSDPQRATVEAAARIRSSASLYQQLALAYQGVIDAWAIGVTTVPAVVVDRRYVVYGEPNVERALSLVRTLKELGK